MVSLFAELALQSVSFSFARGSCACGRVHIHIVFRKFALSKMEPIVPRGVSVGQVRELIVS